MATSLDLSQMSRREFLRLSGAALLSLMVSSRTSYAYANTFNVQEPNNNYGRITTNYIKLLRNPSEDSKEIRVLKKDEILPISKSTLASEPSHNPIWYELDGIGYTHSGNVQPVEYKENTPLKTIPDTGILAEVTMPYTDAVWNPLLGSTIAYRLYYSTTHWVTSIIQDQNGNYWYQILEDFYRFHYYAKANHLRIIPKEEISTLSPSVPESEKRIEVRLNEQVVVAYEGDMQVQMLRCSGGKKSGGEYMTPTGTFNTDYKRPSRHMIDGNDHQMNTYDLPGVPWVSFLDVNGISFHGTYWHNDFGRPRSHGCLNLPSSGAKWIYRWTLPNVPYEEQKSANKGGTFVRISL